MNTIRPTFDGQYYHASPRWHKNVLAFHLSASTLLGYGGKVAPPFSRTFMGGENDVRGFEFYSITPVAFIPSSTSATVLNPDGSQRTQKNLVNGVLTQTTVAQNVPIYQIITPGGDTQAVFNFEYRIPVFGPVTLAPFFDAGLNKILYPNQLKVNPGQIASLNASFPSGRFSGTKLKSRPAPRPSACRPASNFRSFFLSFRPRSAYTTHIILWWSASTCSRRSCSTVPCSPTKPRS